MGNDEMEWHHFPPELEPKPKVLTADLCSAYNVRCWARGGEEFVQATANTTRRS